MERSRPLWPGVSLGHPRRVLPDYQVMAFHGVSNALDTSLAANNGFDPDQLIYHGARFGIEYQR